MAKKIRANFYTGNNNEPYVYSSGSYSTKIEEKELPKNYVKLTSGLNDFDYVYIRTGGVKDVKIKCILDGDQLLEDCCLYISYEDLIASSVITDEDGNKDIEYLGYDIGLSGDDIIRLVLSIEKYSKKNLYYIKDQINNKLSRFKELNPDKYNEIFNGEEVKDLIKYYKLHN